MSSQQVGPASLIPKAFPKSRPCNRRRSPLEIGLGFPLFSKSLRPSRTTTPRQVQPQPGIAEIQGFAYDLKVRTRSQLSEFFESRE